MIKMQTLTIFSYQLKKFNTRLSHCQLINNFELLTEKQHFRRKRRIIKINALEQLDFLIKMYEK